MLPMESSPLYGTPARWPMTNQDEKPQGSKDEAAPAGEADSSGPVSVPRAPFAPPVRDPNVLALLNGLNPSVTPVPFQTATTDGELSAKYEGAPREAPPGAETPQPEPGVVLAPPPPEKKKKPPPDPATLESTFRNRPKPFSATVPVAIALLLIVAGVALWALRGDTPPVANTLPTSTKPTATAIPMSTAPPAPWESAPVPATASAAPAVPSAPRSTPTATPGKRTDIDPGSTPF